MPPTVHMNRHSPRNNPSNPNGLRRAMVLLSRFTALFCIFAGILLKTHKKLYYVSENWYSPDD